MKEVDCLCGERVVFLDDEVQVKTCPNCGSPVYQHGVPSRFQETVRTGRRFRMPSPGIWMAAFLSVVLITVVVIAALSVARTKSLSRASLQEKRADAARLTGDLHTTADAYRRALAVYRKWGSDRASIMKIEDALAEIEAALSQASPTEAAAAAGALGISLEELARQAYLTGPEVWAREFKRSFAGRWVIVHGVVERREGEPYAASSLTLSYRVFSPEGRPVELTFDAPFFERYRLEPGDECLVKAVFSEMTWERSSAAEIGRWVLVSDASASALVTDLMDLGSIGWDIDERLREIVARQSSLSAVF